MKNKTLLQIFRWILIPFIPLILVIGSISILTNDFYVSFEYAKTNFPADTLGFTPQERLLHAADNLRFIRQGLPPAYLEQQTHNGQPLYNMREISHMIDVQSVFQATWKDGIILLGLLLFITIAMTLRKENRAFFFSGIQNGGILTIGLIVSIGLLAILSWNTWFTTFHQLFFQPGTWTFEATDTLIRLFPLPFWFDSALTVSVLTLCGGILLAILGSLFKKKISSPGRV
jgi:integral membrane protein (TIGR01906 family)